MNSDEFRKNGKEMIDYICNYIDSLATKRRVLPAVKAEYLKEKLFPDEAPEHPEPWDNIMSDIENKIMPDINNWQHPRFDEYFPSGISYPLVLGDMLSDGIGCNGFSWASSPACQELETIVLDWCGKAIGLPKEFLAQTEGGKGAGVIQNSADDCILVSMLAARANALERLRREEPGKKDGILLTRLVAYSSQEVHSFVEKASKICLVKLRILEPNERSCLRGIQLQQAMEEDIEAGLIPFFVSVAFGSMSTCSFDKLTEIGPVCVNYDAWLHVDGTYGGNAMICPELQYLLKGIEYASSFNISPNMWLLANFDCSIMWIKDRYKFTDSMVVDPLCLQVKHDNEIIDYRQWGISLSRGFHALKLWFLLRIYGLGGLRSYIRKHCRLAKRFEKRVINDQRFEVCNDVKMGLVCFRLKGTNKINVDLLASINGSGKLYMIPSLIHGKYSLRFYVMSERVTPDDIDRAWEIIVSTSNDILDCVSTDKSTILRNNSANLPSPTPLSAAKGINNEEEKALFRRLSRQYSFTKTVSRDDFQRSRGSLHDGVSPVVIMDDEEDCRRR